MISRYGLQGVVLVLVGLACLGARHWASGWTGMVPAGTTLEQRVTVEPTSYPTATPAPTPGISGTVTITVVYDNNAYDPRLRTAWGFSCLVELVEEETTILFDTGGDGALLLSNMDILGLDPQAIDIVVLSHIHGDHTGGLASVLDASDHPTVYVPRSFPRDFKERVQARTELCQVSGPQAIAPGVYTTGEMGSGIIEQALVLKTAKGLVVITGCAHPGVADMVRKAVEIGQDDPYLVLGGFHLGGAGQKKIEGIIADFQELGVQKLAPCHCTGEKAIALFRAAYGEDCIENGVGKILEIEP